MSFNLIEYIGGLDASIKALDVLRQHRECCTDWDMFNIYGKGRASRTVVGRELQSAYSYRPNMFNLQALESAVEKELAKHLSTIGDRHKVVYNEPTVLPVVLFGASNSDLYDASPKLLIRYNRRGEDCFVTGAYHWKKYEGGVDEFRLDGHNGDWSKYVTGWAYV